MILATNRPDRLDSAVVREGRIDRRIRVNRPDEQDAKEVFRIYLGKVPTCTDPEAMAEEASRHLFSDSSRLLQLTTAHGETFPFTLGNIGSGAMIAGIVDRATSLVMHGVIASGARSKEAMRLTFGHVQEAAGQVREAMRLVDHSDDIRSWAESRATKVVKVVAHSPQLAAAATSESLAGASS